MLCLPHFSTMCRTSTIAAFCLVSAPLILAGQAEELKLAAPAGWGGETITLPPGFAPNMELNGKEHIRFAPGMMKPESDSFFSYAFVFELTSQPTLTQQVVQEEFLKYYRGLCKSVSSGKVSDAKLKTFTLNLQRVNAADTPVTESAQYTGVLNWIEPFRTQKSQSLNVEIHTWSGGDRNYLFACVSPGEKTATVWKQLREIRRTYLQSQSKLHSKE